MEKVKVTDLGRGAKVILDGGWEATLEDDNKNSITRLVKITGMQWTVKRADVSWIKYAEIDGKLYKVETGKDMRKLPIAQNQKIGLDKNRSL